MQQKILWQKAKPIRHLDQIKSSKFTTVFEPVRPESPPDMKLLMENYYGRTWVESKMQDNKSQAHFDAVEKAFLIRGYVDRAVIGRMKKKVNENAETARFILPRFKNVPPKISTYRSTMISAASQ